MGPYKVIQVKNLVAFKGNKRSLDSNETKIPFHPVLFGSLSLETQNITPYCKTFIFQDSSGKVQCYCSKYEETWLQRKVCLFSWNVVSLAYDMADKEDPLPIALELLEVPVAIDADQFLLHLAIRSFSLKELRALEVPNIPTHIEPILLANCKPVTVLQIHQELTSTIKTTQFYLENTHNILVYARVKSKSVLHRKKYSTTCFFLELEEAEGHNSPESRIFLVFKGPYVVGQFYRIEVDEKYLFANLKVQTIFTGKPYSRKVLAFDNQATKIIHATHPLVKIYLKRFPNLSQSSISSDQDPPVIDTLYTWPYVQPNKSSIVRGTVINYTGNITKVIDVVLGIFILDQKYLLYLSHDPSYTPFNGLRVGTVIQLYNAHVLVFSKTSEICQVYFKRFLRAIPNYAIFVGCTYSTVNIVAFSEEESVTRLPKFGSKFAPPRSRTRFNAIDLIHYQTIYFRMKDKFPGAFEDSHLLGPFDVGGQNCPELDPNSSLLVLLLSKLGYTPYTRDLYREFFEHHEHCSTCVERYPSFAFPLLKEVLETVDQCNGRGTLAIEGPNFESKVSIRILNKGDDVLNQFILLGVLQGAPNGELQLSDLSGEIYAIIMTNSKGIGGRLHPEYLNSIWVIPEFEIVIENLGINPAHSNVKIAKSYIRFDINQAFYISKRTFERGLPSTVPDDQQSRYLFRVKHIFPVKISFGVNNEAELSTLVEGNGYVIHETAITPSHLEALASAKAMFLRFTSDSMNLLPGLQIDQTYICQNILPFQESGATDAKQDKQELTRSKRTSGNQANTSKLNAFLVKAYSKIEQALLPTEAYFDEPGSAVLSRSDVSKVEPVVENKKTLNQSEEQIFEVGEIFALFEDDMTSEEVKQGFKEVGKAGKMISFRGKVLKKEIKPSKVRSFYTNEWHLFAFQNFGIGTGKGKQTILLKVQDLANATTLDFYLDLDRFVFPLGVIPGQIITVRKAALKYSEIGNVYTLFTPSTYITTGTERPIPTSILDELERCEDTLASIVDSRFLVQMQKERKKIFKCRCRVIEIQEITLRMICINCENIVREGKCLLGCKQKKISICGEAKVNVEDGTLEAQVIFQDKEEILKLLKLSNRMLERLNGAIEKAGELSYRVTPHWQASLDSELFNEYETVMIDSKSDEERFLQYLCTGSRIRNEVILFVQKITGGDPHWNSEELDYSNAMKSGYYVKTVRLSGSMSIQTLTSTKLLLKAVKLQEITTLAETLLVINELEDLL